VDPAALIARLETFPAAVAACLAGLPDAAWRWRPAEGGWSLIEVLGHLEHEEREDFRTRLRSLLDDPGLAWPPLDPEGAVTAGNFQALDPAATLAAFHRERAASVAWLRGLKAPRWDASRPTRHGPLHAGDLLASWVAHDARHLGQVAKRLHGWSAQVGAPYTVLYAG
jgi:uncharacterized damage-inducible protein DinB